MMKKYILLLLIAISANSAYAQIAIPNGDFELWTTATSEMPQFYPNGSNRDNFYRNNLPFNVIKTVDAYHGTYAISLSTNASPTDTAFGYFINSNPDGNPAAWHGGIPYTETPTRIRGYYKYNVETADSATFIIAFSKAGVNIGTYFYPIGGKKDNYALFDFPLLPALSTAPDSVIIGAISCKFNPALGQPYGPAGSTLLLDSISFVGVATQPAKMNGDFENWDSQDYVIPDLWNFESDNGAGIAKSLTPINGSYAIELTTILGSDNGTPKAKAGYISKGYYPRNCNGNCNVLGGFPFNNKIDTLAFSYKYAPTTNDTASVSLQFKKNGSTIDGKWLGLLASGTYQYTEMPFNISQEPDTIIIEIQSSVWNHQATSYVGSVLTIDDLHFKTKQIPTILVTKASENGITISPNPSKGLIQIKGLSSETQTLEIINASGEKINAQSNITSQSSVEIDLSQQPKGIYFVRIKDTKSTTIQKVVIQ